MTDDNITRRGFLKESIGLGAASLATVVGVGGCLDRPHAEYRSFTSHPVDQIFRDHNGYRLFYTDKRSVVQEKKYLESWCPRDKIDNIPEDISSKFELINRENIGKGVIIIKDLKTGERGFANVIEYSNIKRLDSNLSETYVEVHMPSSSSISPGIEKYGSPQVTKRPIVEIK